MPFVGRGSKNANAAGFLRDATYYWREIMARFPEAFSSTNRAILRGDFAFKSPKADPQFRKIFRQFDQKGLRGDSLIHHHIGGGSQAAAVPSKLHIGSGGIHNIEKSIGVWGKEGPESLLLQRLLEQAKALDTRDP